MTNSGDFLANTFEETTGESETATTAEVGSNLVFTFGAGTLSAAGGAMGAYTIQVAQGTDNALTGTAYLMFFGGGKAINTATTANFVAMTTAKYGATVPTDTTASFYMPSEAITEGTTVTVTDVGDRLNTGDVVALWTGFNHDGTVPVAVCGTGATIIMDAPADSAALAF
jgi:hypothetical protein